MSAGPGAVLDGAVLDRLRDAVGEDFVGELVATFLGDAPAQLEPFRARSSEATRMKRDELRTR